MIHPQAIVDPAAELHERVSVGPWSIIGPGVTIGADTKIESHVVIKGPTVIGERCRVFQFSTIGEETPDLKYKGEDTRLVIGDDNTIREGVTLHRGTVQDRGETTIGNNNLIMPYAHVGHDSVIGDHVILVNNSALAGHVIVDDWAVLGGYTLVYQRCRIGAHAFTGMGTQVGKDIPAFVMAYGAPAKARAVNVEGLKRRDFSADDIALIRRGFKTVYRQGMTVEQALESLEADAANPHMQTFSRSIRESGNGIVR